jgi:hypothetical protein
MAGARHSTGLLRGGVEVIDTLSRNLSLLDDIELRNARLDRDERMSLLFNSWPSLTKIGGGN